MCPGLTSRERILPFYFFYFNYKLTKQIATSFTQTRSLVPELAVLALDEHLRLALLGLDPPHDLRVDAELLAGGDDGLRLRGGHVDLEAVATVEDLVHLAPGRAAALLDETEEGRHGQHVVLDNAQPIVEEVAHFGLRPAAAVDHAVHLRARHGVEQGLDHGGVGARRAEDELAHGEACLGLDVGELVLAAVHERRRHRGVEALRVARREVVGEDVVPRRGETVGAHAAIVLGLVGRLAVGGEADDYVARADRVVADDVAPPHARRDRAVDHHSAHEVTEVGRLAARADDAHAGVAHRLQHLLGAADERLEHLARDEVLVPPDGRRQQNVVGAADAQQVVRVHDDGVLGDAAPHAQVARLLPVHVRQAALGARPVGVHARAPLRVASDVRDDLAEGLREEALVDVGDRRVHVLLGRANATRHVPLASRVCLRRCAHPFRGSGGRAVDSSVAREEWGLFSGRQNSSVSSHCHTSKDGGLGHWQVTRHGGRALAPRAAACGVAEAQGVGDGSHGLRRRAVRGGKRLGATGHRHGHGRSDGARLGTGQRGGERARDLGCETCCGDPGCPGCDPGCGLALDGAGAGTGAGAGASRRGLWLGSWLAATAASAALRLRGGVVAGCAAAGVASDAAKGARPASASTSAGSRVSSGRGGWGGCCSGDRRAARLGLRLESASSS
eukprot:scaffold66881_cov63-Phaeocystis_antarctica.AAC.1